MDILNTVLEDIRSFLEQNKEFFFNERDFQMHLATALKNVGKYDDVDVEYAIPSNELISYPWNESDFRVDIVVRKGSEYLPIELKYKTRSLKCQKAIDRFGENIDCEELVKNQGARDLGMYGFWKDVFRIEQLKMRFPKTIKNGIAILLTNDEGYKCKNLRDNVIYKNFSMSEGEHEVSKCWSSQESKVAQNTNYPNFELNKKYALVWHKEEYNGETFYYTIASI